MKIVTVLRSGGDFNAKHVQALQRQVRQYAPWADFVCLSDVDIADVETLPLVHDWPKWWAKMELFDPRLHGDFLFMDLDTVIVGPLDDLLAVRELTLLRDFYRDGSRRTEGLQSSLMRVPPIKEVTATGLMHLRERDRDTPWSDFIKSPAKVIQTTHGGDQAFLEPYFLRSAKRFQDVTPGQVVSYKVHCCQHVLGKKDPVFRGVPDNARIICFHGKPRPWDLPQFEGLYTW